jgi:YtkA-like
MLFKILIIPFILFGCIQPKYSPKEELNPSAEIKSCPNKLTSGKCVSLDWEVLPTEEEFVIKIWRPNLADETEVVEDIKEDIYVFLWMPSMNHGSSPVAIKQVDVGTYRVNDVFFTMPGEWAIHIQLKNNNEIKDQTVIPFSF